MSAESNAYTHVYAFRWWAGHPELSEEEARRRDLEAVRKAADEALGQLTDEVGGDAS